MKRLNIIILLTSIALLSLTTVQFYSIQTSIKYSNEVERISKHSNAIGQINIIMNIILNIETSIRGFILMGKPAFLEPYFESLKFLPLELNKLSSFLKKDQLNKFNKLINIRVAAAKNILDKKSKNKMILPADFASGKMAMDNIRKEVSLLIADERDAIKKNYGSKSSDRLIIELIFGSLFTIIMITICILYIIYEFINKIKTEKILSASLATSEAITRDVEFGIIACDSLGEILFFNKWINSKNKKSVKFINDYFSEKELPLLQLKQLIHGELESVYNIKMNFGEEDRVFKINSSPFIINENKKGVILSIIDTTDTAKEISSLITSKDIAESASLAKSDFLAKMSHEIRTPLNAMLGVGEILSLSKLDKEQEYCLEIFKRSSSVLNNLVNDILDLSKIEAGKIDIIEASFSLKNLVSSCVSIMDYKASQKGLLFTVNIESEFDHFVGDEGRLRQVLINLLSNAIKFTDKGEIKFLIKCIENDGAKCISFAIRDTGRGISSENIGKLFLNYNQENSAISKQFGGTGLGLSLSRELAILMGGDITLKSNLGLGSEFIFTIFLHTGEGLFIEEEIDTNIKFNDLNILFVDDNHENLFIVKKYLNDLNINITEAIDGEDAVDKFQKNKYDLIFMDINMPKKDGLVATAEIRSIELENKIDRTFIVALSANAFSVEYNKALAAGCDDYLTKPISRNKLITKIKKYGKEKISLVENKAISTSIDDDFNDDLIDIDIRAMIPQYLESRKKDLLVMRDSYSRNEISKISKLVHNIKGTALSYGQNKLDEIARSMELAIKDNRVSELEEYFLKIETLLGVNNGN